MRTLTKIQLHLTKQDTTANLNVEHAESHHLDRVIEGMFGVFGVQVGQAVLVPSAIAEQIMATAKAAATLAPPLQVTEEKTRLKYSDPDEKCPTYTPGLADKSAASFKPELVKPDFVNRNPNPMTTKVYERLPQDNPFLQDRPQFTGIKTEPDGSKTYKASYICPNEQCNDVGFRFVKETNDYCKCRSCGTKLRLRFATSAGFPDKDEDNNFFIADSYFE